MNEIIPSFPYNLVLDELVSTNDYARRMGEAGAPHGTWISARRQTAGRGRMGRSWSSAEGNLFLSIVVRPPSSFPVTWIPLAVALSVLRAAGKVRSDWDLAVKWPNDLGLRDRKVGFRKWGGILCEGVGSSSGSFIVVGIGVNCAIAPETDQPTASLGVLVDSFRDEVRRNVLSVFEESIDSIRAEYFESSLLRAGDAIEWRDLHDSTGRTFQGLFSGYGENGELLAEEMGKTRRLFSEEIKLLPRKR